MGQYINKMFQLVEIKKVSATLESNISKLEAALVRLPVLFEDLNKLNNLASAFNEMNDLRWKLNLTERFLGLSLRHDQIAPLYNKIINGINNSVYATEIWKSKEKRKLHRFNYFKKKFDNSQERLIKQILAFEPYIDATIAIRHTNEFGQSYETANINPNDFRNCSIGYHEPGIVLGNFIYPLKFLSGVNPEYENLRELFRH